MILGMGDEVSAGAARALAGKAYLVGSIVVPHLREVLLEDLLIESSLAHVYNL
jgi:hypothetical protein